MLFTCPFCYNQHDTNDIMFRCTNTNCKKKGPDKQLEWYENGMKQTGEESPKTSDSEISDEELTENTYQDKSAVGYAFVGDGNPVKSGAKCDGCGEISYQRICPTCHNTLSEYVYEDKGKKNLIVSVVGQRGSGKSVYMGVLLHEIFDVNNSLANILPNGSTEGRVANSRRKQIFGRLYAKRGQTTTLDQTQSSITNAKENGAYRPFTCVFRYVEKSKGFLGKLFKQEKRNSFGLCLFDAAGEDLQNENNIGITNKYLSHSTGIIFLLDPMHLSDFVDQLTDENDIKNASSGLSKEQLLDEKLDTTFSVFEIVTSRIRNEHNLSKDKRIDIPLAIVVSKCDMIWPFLKENATVKKNVYKNKNLSSYGGFLMADSNQVNHEIQQFLCTYGAEGFIKQIENNFSNVRYFATSALGVNNNPTLSDGKQSIKTPTPHRIADPLYWFWSEAGILDKIE